MSKRVLKDRVFLRLAWLLLSFSLWLCLREIPLSSPARSLKTPSSLLFYLEGMAGYSDYSGKKKGLVAVHPIAFSVPKSTLWWTHS